MQRSTELMRGLLSVINSAERYNKKVLIESILSPCYFGDNYTSSASFL